MTTDYRSALSANPWLTASLVVALLLAMGVGLPEADDAAAETPVVARSGGLTIEIQEEVRAGEGFDVFVEGLVPGVSMELIIDSGYGLRRMVTSHDRSSATVNVTAFAGPASGLILITAVQGDRVATATTTIVPGPPVDPIDVYLGPRTVIADAEHFVMIVAVPEDNWGNPVSDETSVLFTTTRPNQVVETKQYGTEHLLAWYEVYSRTVSGRTRIATESGVAGAPERDFLEVADKPEPYALELVDPLLPADGQALITVVTDILADGFGNVMPDGTVVMLDARGATGIRRVFSQTIDGRGEFTLAVPDVPGDVTLVATASGVQSEPLELSFVTAVQSIEASIELGTELAMVHVGPVRSVRASFVPEGTLATVTAADGTVSTAPLSLGVGTAYFSLDADLQSVTVEVLGTEIRVRPS